VQFRLVALPQRQPPALSTSCADQRGTARRAGSAR
jgi:hypothetical protein